MSAPEMPKVLEQVLTARAAIISKEGKRRAVSGSIVCPIDGSQLNYRIATNGHVHAACDNAGCVRWME